MDALIKLSGNVFSIHGFKSKNIRKHYFYFFRRTESQVLSGVMHKPFESIPYIQTDAVFWPDYWRTAIENPIWSIVEAEDFHLPEQESGQILINRKKCWNELNLCLYFNIKSKIYYQMFYGDKDTFKFAWQALKSPFHMIEEDLATCGYLNQHHGFLGTTMVQHGMKI